MNFSTVPPIALELGADARVVRLQQPSYVLGIHRLCACREADEVAEEASDDLALLARVRLSATSGVAQPEQKRASSAFSRPQLGQTFTRGG